MEDLSRFRQTEFPIDPLFRDRWSPRAMAGEELTRDELMSLFEAARWAPSSYNNQPWRFVYAQRGSEHWQDFLNLLVDFNRGWAHTAGALVIIAAKKTFDNGKPSVTHALDTGAAWENLALQGARRELVVHGMEGFDYEKAHRLAGFAGEYVVLAMAAIGKPGRKEALEPALREREVPSGRRPLSELVFEGRFHRE